MHYRRFLYTAIIIGFLAGLAASSHAAYREGEILIKYKPAVGKVSTSAPPVSIQGATVANDQSHAPSMEVYPGAGRRGCRSKTMHRLLTFRPLPRKISMVQDHLMAACGLLGAAITGSQGQQIRFQVSGDRCWGFASRHPAPDPRHLSEGRMLSVLSRAGDIRSFCISRQTLPEE